MSNYQWNAIYNDNTNLPQFELGNEHKYKDIDRSKLIAFELKETAISPTPIIRINLESGQRLIYRRRTQIHMVGLERNEDIFHLIGWQQTINGQNIQSMLLIHPSGDIEMIGKWKDDHVLYCAPVLIDAEKVS